jgi:hypothetical protein
MGSLVVKVVRWGIMLIFVHAVQSTFTNVGAKEWNKLLSASQSGEIEKKNGARSLCTNFNSIMSEPADSHTIGGISCLLEGAVVINGKYNTRRAVPGGWRVASGVDRRYDLFYYAHST